MDFSMIWRARTGGMVVAKKIKIKLQAKTCEWQSGD
jgi:hypothetical protein